MTANHHTPIATGAAANAATLNAPLGELDSGLTTTAARVAGSIDADGTLKAGAVDNTAVLADEVVTSVKLAADLTDKFPGSLENELGQELVQATVDVNGRVAEGITSDGSKLIGESLLSSVYKDTTLGLLAAQVDNQRRIMFGSTVKGPVVGNEWHQINEPYTLGLAWGIMDDYGRLVIGVTSDGKVVGDFDLNLYGSDINHVIGTGQSLSIGGNGGAAITTSQPHANLMFSGASQIGFAPLVGNLPGSSGGTTEAPYAAMANLITDLVLAGTNSDRLYTLLMSTVGVGSAAYSAIKKGGTDTAYANSIAQVWAAKKLAETLGRSYRAPAVTLIHGEQDHADGTTQAAYAADILEMQQDYNTDIRAITGQADPVRLFTCQMSSWTGISGTTSLIPYAQLQAAENNPGKVYLVCPKYMLPYADAVHLTALSYQRLGEYYAKAYQRVIIERKTWKPLSPAYVSRVGAVITAIFNVPVAPLVLDTTVVSDPGDYGFEYTDDGVPPGIASVVLSGPNVVTITLDGVPAGANKKLRYAYTGALGANGGPTTGPRGCLRDSDATVSRSGHLLYNYCIHFEKAIS